MADDWFFSDQDKSLTVGAFGGTAHGDDSMLALVEGRFFDGSACHTGVSSGRLYWENKGAFFDARGITIPVAVSAFPDELYQCPQSWAQAAYSKLLFYKKHDIGGHFAAWEQPKLLTEDLRAAFKPLR